MNKIMNSLRRSMVGSFLLLSLLLGSCATQPVQTPEDSVAKSLELTDCQLSSPGMGYSVSAQCGMLSVYENQSTQSGRKIELYVAVVKAVSRNAQPDALFLLAGGPGEAATQSFSGLLGVLEHIRQKRDLVLFDQRGTGKSSPLTCKESTDEETEEDSETVKTALEECAGSLEADLTQYTTAAAAEDIEQVRKALGYPQINLLGISYGTKVAQAYMRQYPQSTRSVILDSVVPLDWELGPYNAENAQRALDMLFTRCENDATCKSTFPDLRQEFASMQESLEAEPIELTLPDPTSGESIPMTLDWQSLATTIQLALYTPEYSAILPLLIHTAYEKKDYQLLAAQYQFLLGSLNESITSGLYYSVICSEDVPFYPTETGTVESFLPYSGDKMKDYCTAWPSATIEPEFHQAVQSDLPVLILSGEADPITPPANGEQAAQKLSHALQLVIPGMGHANFTRGCLPRVISDFVENGAVEGLDTGCVSEFKPAPFFTNFAGPQP